MMLDVGYHETFWNTLRMQEINLDFINVLKIVLQ